MSVGLPQDVNLIVIATSATGSRAHFYPDAKSLLAAVVGLGTTADADVRVEFFDKQGVRMHPVVAGKWQIVGIAPGVDDPGPEIVLSRLRTAVGDVENFLLDPATENALARMKLSPKEAVARLPRLDGVTDLAEAIRRCDGTFGHGDADTGHDGSLLHNLFVHGIF
ncbi:hypothetical protein Aph02nite_45930 [Actinoplanes philippinensis]|uniref:Uncharacterized protein n=1 Tax=Actinoplanes philippinensis TaxID=35752 RepID=A0A1I2I640_9ACTN|nr:hypothetical protein [Actinoplanes philippinensis]GIE78643.1 hypothetical protein Aph02nite_45930 [Actinoplanes philippinensis]SFF37108.1 hypothetical protein SAMN05421541_109288 [Actinoplanes philippinensis]